jgi:hypothetical protein
MRAPLGADEKLAIVAPIAAYWITSGIYALLAAWCPSYRLHSKSEEERNLVPKTVVFRTMVLMQIFQAALSTVFFKVRSLFPSYVHCMSSLDIDFATRRTC